MSVVLEPTTTDLIAERARILADCPFSESVLRERALSYSVTPSEARALRRLDEIRFLLGEND